MENKKVEEPKKKTEADPAQMLRAAEQKRRQIIDGAKKEAYDEAMKTLKEVEQKGRQIINEAAQLAQAEADKIIAQAEQKARQIAEEAKKRKPDAKAEKTRAEAQQEGLLIIEAARGKAETEASKIIAQAEEKARQIIEEAKGKTQAEANIEKPPSAALEEERSIIQDAKRKAEATANKMIAAAEEKGIQIIDQARKKAEVEANQIVAQAEEKAHQIIAEAKKQAGNKVITEKVIPDTEQETRTIVEEAERIATAQPPAKPSEIVKAGKKAPTETKGKGEKQKAPTYKEAELVIVPPIDFPQLERLRIALQQLTNVRSLAMVGSSGGGTSISIELHRPAALIPELEKIEAVEEAIGEESLDAHLLGEWAKKTLPQRTSNAPMSSESWWC